MVERLNPHFRKNARQGEVTRPWLYTEHKHEMMFVPRYFVPNTSRVEERKQGFY